MSSSLSCSSGGVLSSKDLTRSMDPGLREVLGDSYAPQTHLEHERLQTLSPGGHVFLATTPKGLEDRRGGRAELLTPGGIQV